MMEQEYTSKSYHYRGLVISTFNTLEKRIEIMMSHYFTKKLDTSFISIILDRLNFEAKRTSLKALFEQMEMDTKLFSSDNNLKPNKKIFEEIRLLSLERNYFAHYILAFPDNYNDYAIVLSENRDRLTSDKLKNRFYSHEKINSIVNRINKVADDLEDKYSQYLKGVVNLK